MEAGPSDNSAKQRVALLYDISLWRGPFQLGYTKLHKHILVLRRNMSEWPSKWKPVESSSLWSKQGFLDWSHGAQV